MKTLSLKERVILSNCLPTQGKFEDLIIREDVMKKIAVTAIDLEKYEIKTIDVGNGMAELKWSAEGNTAKFDIDFTESEERYVKKALSDISEKGELNIDQVSLYKAFS